MHDVYTCGMRKRLLDFLANVLAAVTIVLLVIDPDRPITPIVCLLAVALACAVLPAFVRESAEKSDTRLTPADTRLQRFASVHRGTRNAKTLDFRCFLLFRCFMKPVAGQPDQAAEVPLPQRLGRLAVPRL
jgi:hypothetical protein